MYNKIVIESNQKSNKIEIVISACEKVFKNYTSYWTLKIRWKFNKRMFNQMNAIIKWKLFGYTVHVWSTVISHFIFGVYMYVNIFKGRK